MSLLLLSDKLNSVQHNNVFLSDLIIYYDPSDQVIWGHETITESDLINMRFSFPTAVWFMFTDKCDEGPDHLWRINQVMKEPQTKKP